MAHTGSDERVMSTTVIDADVPVFTRRSAIAGAAATFFAGCRAQRSGPPSAKIEFTRIPEADEGGRSKHEIIQGRVHNAQPGQRVVLYAKSKKWWVQPLADRPFTPIPPNDAWTNATHLGMQYAALLVGPNFRPSPTLDSLPNVAGDVLAVAVADGATHSPSRTIQFAGYEWRVRDAPSARGGHNIYRPDNVRVDEHGALHMKLDRQAGDWTCAEVSCTRSLGYGTYSFVVQDISMLEPSAAFTIFTWDYSAPDEYFHEMDIEISRSGNPAGKNAQYVMQPYYVPANVERFVAPKGVLTHSVLWEPARLTFRTDRGTGIRHSAPPVAERILTHGVPSPAMESFRMNLYVMREGSHFPLTRGAEVVIENFEFLP